MLHDSYVDYIGQIKRISRITMGVFEDAVQNFVKGFAYTGAVKHLLNRGYSIERIMREYDYRLSREELDRIYAEWILENERNEEK